MLQGVGCGHTTFKVLLSWGIDTVREVEIPIYVNQQPMLSIVTDGRGSSDYSGDSSKNTNSWSSVSANSTAAASSGNST